MVDHAVTGRVRSNLSSVKIRGQDESIMSLYSSMFLLCEVIDTMACALFQMRGILELQNADSVGAVAGAAAGSSGDSSGVVADSVSAGSRFGSGSGSSFESFTYETFEEAP